MEQRLQRDIGSLQAGQQHALVYLTVLGSGDGEAKGNTASCFVNDLLGPQLPASAVVQNRSATDWAIWLPLCDRGEALTVSRLLRRAIFQFRSDATDLGRSKDSASGAGCAIGIVVVTDNNWAADALLKTAQITASIARFSDSDEIRVADQIDPTKF